MKVVFVFASLFIGVHCGLLKDIVSGDKSNGKKDDSGLTKVVYEVDDKTTGLVETLKDTLNLNEKKDEDEPTKRINNTKVEAEKEKATVKPTDEKNEINKKESEDVKKKETDKVPDDKEGDNKVEKTKDAKEVTHSNGKNGTESSTPTAVDTKK